MTASPPVAPRTAAPPRSSTAVARDEAERLDEAQSLTPTLGARLRSSRMWMLVGAVAVITAFLSVLLNGLTNSAQQAPLDPDSPRPEGAKALVQVLRGHGVEATVASSLDEVDALIGADAADTTLVLLQRDVFLDDAQLGRLRDLGVARIVLIAPGPSVLEGLGSGIQPGGRYDGDGTSTIAAGAACTDPIGANAPEITNFGGALFRLGDGVDGASCYVENDRAAVVVDRSHSVEIVAIGAAPNLSNERIALDGNGAMAIGLLGDSSHLVWYTPGADDLATPDGAPPIELLIPGWLTPAIMLLMAAGVATMVWLGRRHGPLVAERLPVVVPASETMDGRARLYQRTGSRLRALDNLRIGTTARLARALNLNRTTPVHEVAIAVANVTGRPRDEVLAVLVDAAPGTDGELVELSDHLLRLERACLDALAVPDERTGSPARPDASGRPGASDPATAPDSGGAA